MKTNTTLTTRRRLLASVPAVAAAGVPGAAMALSGLPAGDDPIIEAIADYEEALAARLANEDEDLDTNLMEDEFGALEYVFHTMPTTIAGAAALVELWAKMPYGEDVDDSRGECVMEMAFTGWKHTMGIRALANLGAALRQIATAA